MRTPIVGLHHVTVIASDPQRNLDFYTQVLGLRFVKRTVNFDDPETYHFYFGDDIGTPGTILTFFPWPGTPKGRRGAGETMSSGTGSTGAVAAALALLGQAPVGPQGRRIAVLGDMLELGQQGVKLHSGLAEPIAKANLDLVYCSGPLMRSLWEALPSGRRGGYAETAAELESSVLDAIRDGDAVMVKGSLGSKMGPIVKALERQFPKQAALEQSA